MDDGGDKPKRLTLRKLARAERRIIAKRRRVDEGDFNPLAHLERIFEEEDRFKSMKYRKKRRNMRNRSKLRFYKYIYGFRAPFRLLVDKSFIKHVIAKQAHRMDYAKRMIGRFIGEKCKLFATSCTIDNCLREMGNIAHLLKVVRCDHRRTTTVQCLERTLKTDNANDKFILAIADQKLLRTFMRTPALPIVWANRENWTLMGAHKMEKEDRYLLKHAACGCNGNGPEVCEKEACVYVRANGLAI